MIAASERKRRSLTRQAFQLLRMLAVALGTGIAWLNIRPYLQLVLWLAPEPSDPTIQFLLGVPLLGSLISGGGWLIALSGGIVIWACVQLAQLLPDLIRRDRANLRHTLDTYRQSSGDRLEAREDDPEVVRNLINFYNSLPASWIKALFRCQTIAFIVDALAAVIIYPPLLVDARIFLSAPTPQDVDWLNVGIIMLCVFTANTLLWLVTFSEQLTGYVQQEKPRG